VLYGGSYVPAPSVFLASSFPSAADSAAAHRAGGELGAAVGAMGGSGPSALTKLTVDVTDEAAAPDGGGGAVRRVTVRLVIVQLRPLKFNVTSKFLKYVKHEFYPPR